MRQTTFWQLSLSAAGSGSTTSEYRQFYGDGTSGPTTYGGHTSATAYVNAANINGGTASAWISATLSGVDAADAGGQRIASASFSSDGTGALDLQSTTTTPEPSSSALLGTGLMFVFTFKRRRGQARR